MMKKTFKQVTLYPGPNAYISRPQNHFNSLKTAFENLHQLLHKDNERLGRRNFYKLVYEWKRAFCTRKMETINV